MSASYVAVQWNRHKRRYDAAIVAAIVAYLLAFVGVGKLLWRTPEALSDEVLILRAVGSCALVLLHVVLCIGPLARLDDRWIPWLYNRRHLGVATFLIALMHGGLAVGYYHGFGNVNPLVSVLSSNTQFNRIHGFPFEFSGAHALIALFVLAATSHDFWLKNLTPRVWKIIHMASYSAYTLTVIHVALGALQTSRGWMLAVPLLGGVSFVCLLHAAAGVREVRKDAMLSRERADGTMWLDAGPVEEIPMNQARAVCAPGGERIAVFRHAGGVSAVTSVCAHQGGPLAEGRIVDGCITCPWHGWQYRPEDGRAPPPFQERLATHEIRIVEGRVKVQAEPNSVTVGKADHG